MKNSEEKIIGILYLALSLCLLASCSDDWSLSDAYDKGPAERVPVVEKPRVLVLYSAGFNNLSSDLDSDVDDLASGYLPYESMSSDVLLLYSRRVDDRYTSETPSYLIRLYCGGNGEMVRDTLESWPGTVKAASAQAVSQVFTYVKDKYPDARYGMIFSSHATGWLPSGYYSTGKLPSSVQKDGLEKFSFHGAVPYVDEPYDPSYPRVKSMGADNVGYSQVVEMEIEDFAEALPMKFEYIIFDACLMGGVEVAYALRDKCGTLVFSPAEVLSEGLCDYHTVVGHLLGRNNPDLYGVCEDSYNYYSSLPGDWQSLTVSMVDCSKMESLALACKELFNNYRDSLANVQPENVQRYFRFNKHWFYDIEDIMLESNIPATALSGFQDALAECIMYKAATPEFIPNQGGFEINHYSGLSMYLPSDGNADLNSFYKTLSWNKATELVSE